MGVKFTSYFSAMDMMEALRGKVGDKKSYQDFGYFGVLGAEFDEDGVATGDYPPKPAYYALSCLASLFAGEISPCTLPILPETDTAPHCGNIPTLSWGEIESYGFRLANGSYAYAYWAPVNHLTQDFESAVSFCYASFDDLPKLVDPMDGTVYEIPEEMMEKNAYGGIILHRLPIRDYPLLLVFGSIE